MALILIMSAACSDSESVTSLTELGVDDGASEGADIQKSVRAGSEASLELPTGAKVRIPEGSTDKDLTVGLKRPNDDEALELVKSLKDKKLASAPYVLTPHGSKFDQDVEVTLPVTKGRNVEKLKVAWLEDEDDTTWELIGAPDVEGDRATIKVKHFSVFALVEATGGGVAVELDGGVAPSDELDAGDSADAATRTDASAQVDAGVQLDGGDYSPALYSKLQSCGLLERPGDFAPIDVSDPEDVCYLNCLVNASCQEFRDATCDNLEAYTGGLKACLVACFGESEFIPTTPDFCGPGLEAELCDGWEDCSDGSDEIGCPAGTHFNCGNGERIPTGNACDGSEDCRDGSDENNCPSGTHFVCADGQRVPADRPCDGDYDCNDKSDEANCPASHYFACGDGKTVPKGVMCDTYNDCSNGADEADCASKLFTCADGSDKFGIESVCDGDRDCADGSDEPSRCAKLSCEWDL